MSEELKTLDIKGQSVDVASLNKINLKGLEIEIPKGVTVHVIPDYYPESYGVYAKITTDEIISNIIFIYTSSYAFNQLPVLTVASLVYFSNDIEKRFIKTAYGTKAPYNPTLTKTSDGYTVSTQNISSSVFNSAYGYMIIWW